MVTQIVGTLEKKSDTELTFNSSDTGMKMTLTFDPAKVSLSLKAGEYVLSKRVNDTTYFYRTAIWDINHYGTFMKLIRQQIEAHNAGQVSDADFAKFQKVVPGIYNYYASNQLTMTARMSYSKADKMVAGILEDSGKNAAYIKSLKYLGPLGFPLNSFNGNVFAIYKYNQQGTQLYLNGPLFLLQPVMLFHPLSTSAKPAAFMQKR